MASRTGRIRIMVCVYIFLIEEMPYTVRMKIEEGIKDLVIFYL